MPPVQLGIITHSDNETAQFEAFLTRAFPDLLIATHQVPSKLVVLSPVQRDGVMAEAAAWIRARPLNLVFLETNLGQAGQPVSTFDPAFFGQLPDVRFVLFDGSNVDVAALRGIPNILAFVQKPNVFRPFEQAIHDTIGDLATVPDEANPGERGPTIADVGDNGPDSASSFGGDLDPGGNLHPAQPNLGGLPPAEGNAGGDGEDDPEEAEGGE